MIDVLIFSRDRPAQLDLLLRSIDKNARQLHRFIYVQYRATQPEYQNGYALCAGYHRPIISWRKESSSVDFGEMVRAWLRGEHEWISFLVDDDVYYRQAARFDPGTVNPRYCSGTSHRGGDFDYPFSLDGVIYHRDDVTHLLEGLRFRNPTELEAVGHEHRSRLPFGRLLDGGACLTGLPWNRVSPMSGMPHMGIHEYDLNERFLGGERLELPQSTEPLQPHTFGLEPHWEGIASVH